MQDMSEVDRKRMWVLGGDADELGLLTIVDVRPILRVLGIHVGRRLRHENDGGCISVRRERSAKGAILGLVSHSQRPIR